MIDVYRSLLVQAVSLKAFKVTVEGIFFKQIKQQQQKTLSTPAGTAPVIIFLES